MTARSSDAIVLGIDASTTACKAVAFDATGHVLAEGRHPIALSNPGPDAWEQDADEWWSALEHALASVARALGKDAARIRALAIANQRETFVVTDPAGTPLHPALVWMDARCRPEVAQATAALGAEALHAVTGKPPCVTPSFYKALYLFERKAPALRGRDLRLLDVHGFLAWRLTGELVTSTASADPLGLLDIATGDYSDRIIEHLGLGRNHLARLTPPGATIGALAPDVARRAGLPEGVMVIAGAGDGQAAGLGAGITDARRAYLNLGTAIVSGLLTREKKLDRAFRTLLGAMPGTFFLETDLKGGTFTLGWLVEKWLRRAGDSRSDDVILRELEVEATKLGPGAAGLMLVPYWNGVMNPYWDDDATGLVLGFRGDHGPAHFYRAIVEGICFEQRLHSRAVEAATGVRIDEFVVMGGGAKSALFCQTVADVLGRRVVRSKTAEATALGAAMLAAPAAGMFRTIDEAAAAMSGCTDAFEPGEAAPAYDRLFEDVYSTLYPSVRAAMTRLRNLA